LSTTPVVAIRDQKYKHTHKKAEMLQINTQRESIT
jgi:hypothetical protein